MTAPDGRPAGRHRQPPEPPLTDGVVLLRAPGAADAEAIAMACRDPEIARWIPVPVPYLPADARAFLDETAEGWSAGTDHVLAIVERTEGTLAGMVGLHQGSAPERASVGYWLAPNARGRGLATRAVRLVTVWAFADPALERLELLTLVGNDASGRVALRAGFRREGILRRYLQFRETLVDAVMYARLRDDGSAAASDRDESDPADAQDADRLEDALDEWDQAATALGMLAAGGGPAATPLAAELLDTLREEVARRVGEDPVMGGLDATDRGDPADRRDAVTALLAALGMPEPGEPAAALAALGWDGNELDDLLEPFGDDEARLVVVAWLAATARLRRLLAGLAGRPERRGARARDGRVPRRSR